MATLQGKITDVTGRTPDSISAITVKAPSARIGGSGASSVIVTSPATVNFNQDTGDITINNITEGLSWLYIEGEGWSDSIALAVANGMITLVEAIANASGVPGLVDFIDLLEQLRQNMQDVVTDEFALNSTEYVGYANSAGKNVQLDESGKLQIITSQITREQDVTSKGYVDTEVIAATKKIGATRLIGESLDDLTTPGYYYQTDQSGATPERGYPFQYASSVTVLPRSGDNSTITQVVVPDTQIDAGFAMRTRRGATSPWSAWDIFEPTVVAAQKITAKRLLTENLNNITQPGFFYQTDGGGATAALNYPFPVPCTLTVLPRSGDNSTVTQIVIPDSQHDFGMAVRTRRAVSEGWSGWDILDVRATNDTRYAAKDHNHDGVYATTADVTSKADKTHTHSVGDVSGLSTTLTNYATKSELAGVAAGDSIALSDATVAGLLTTPTSSTAQTLTAQTQQVTGELYADIDYTGTTDVSTPINLLIQEAGRTGAAIKLGVGTLRLDAPIRPVDGTQLIGSGIGKTILKPQGPAHAINTGDRCDDVTFRDFEIDGSDQTLPEGETVYQPTWAKGVFMEYMRRVNIENLYIHDTGATGLGIDFITGTIRNVWAVRCGRLNDGTGAGGSGIGIGVGRLDEDWEPLTIVGCHAEGNSRFGIFLENQDTGLMPAGITVTGCTSVGNKDGIGECGTTGTVIAHNHIRNNTRSGVAVDSGTMNKSTPGRMALIQGNDITGNTTAGILMLAAGLDESIDGVRVMDNHIWENTGPGIKVITSGFSTSEVAPFVRNVRIEGNDIHHNGDCGVLGEQSGASHPGWSRVLIARNRVWGNGTAGIVNQDAGFKITAPTEHLVFDGNHTWDEGVSQPRSIALSNTHSGLKINQEYLHAPAVIPG